MCLVHSALLEPKHIFKVSYICFHRGSESSRNALSASTRSGGDCARWKHTEKVWCQCISVTSAMLHHASCQLNTAQAGISNNEANWQLQTSELQTQSQCSLLAPELSLTPCNFFSFHHLTTLTSFLSPGSVLHHSGCCSASIQVSPPSHPSQQGADPSSSPAKAAIHSKGTEQGSHH